jgi:tRNA(His) 5'-end guanylyltransferase
VGNDSLGDRIKRYERAGQHHLPPRQPLLIRVDGRAFHTYTRHMTKPFSPELMGSMTYAMRQTAKDMMGFKLAYHQSDEVTFLLTDYDRLATQGWFDYELNKVVSLVASTFTAHFTQAMLEYDPPGANGIATFDARAFVVPAEDVPNVFVWRQRDWERNSIAMLAQAHYSHKQLHGKKIPDMHDMLHEKGINWAELPGREKNGTFLLRDGTIRQEKACYDDIEGWIAKGFFDGMEEGQE